jgi:ABC-type enterochelin transport system substrate-binding protein
MSEGYYGTRWSIAVPIATGTGTTTLLAGATGKTHWVRKVTVEIATAAAQAFDIEDTPGTIELVKEPASRVVGCYIYDYGDLGVKLTAAAGLVYTATAGVQLNIAAHGYTTE